MPIDSDNTVAVAIANTKSVLSIQPTYFHRDLTGRGGKTGLLNEYLTPHSITTNPPLAILPEHIDKKRSHGASAEVTIQDLPLNPVCHELRKAADSIKTRAGSKLAGTLTMPAVATLLQLKPSADHKPVSDITYYLGIEPQGVVVAHTAAHGMQSKQHNIYVNWLTTIYKVVDPEDLTTVADDNGTDTYNIRMTVMGYDVHKAINELLDRPSLVAYNTQTNHDAIDNYLREYSIYDAITAQAEAWSTDIIGDEISNLLDAIFDKSKPRVRSVTKQMKPSLLSAIESQIRYLENYNVSLDAYTKIYNALLKHIPANVSELCKYNLNLLMNDTLHNLSVVRDELCKPPTAPAPTGTIFSQQQLQAIAADDPLVLIQAAAGSGKSTVILARIEHLIANGVKPEDITVISFTNAAADNITAKNPDVGSMTIAKMIHDTYELNYPSHKLSGIDTIINSLKIFFPRNDLAVTFVKHLLAVEKNNPRAHTELNVFIEDNFDEIISMLDEIEQTSLELEIMICYQRVNELKQPPHVKSKHLIVDEVQDTSIFEFIYVLRYITRQRESLYLVGDCAQTLYEFRNSNPKALNALEASKLFTTYQLTTNYRSNQEILDFANIALADIEANQYANISMRANSPVIPTAASFKEKVILDCKTFKTATEFRQTLNSTIMFDIKDYIDQCLARGEQVAFIAYNRVVVDIIHETLSTMYPAEEVANLVPERVFSNTFFSQFIRNYWNDMTQVMPEKALFAVRTQIMNSIGMLDRNVEAATPKVAAMLDEWWSTNTSSIEHRVARYKAGGMTREEFFNSLRKSLLNHEIHSNLIRQSVINQRNNETKQENADAAAKLIVSTIHSVKGLEFDNVVVIHQYSSAMDEADKRLYYVGFTRAKNTEYVLSWSSLKRTKIKDDYETLTKALVARDRARAQDITP